MNNHEPSTAGMWRTKGVIVEEKRVMEKNAMYVI